MVLRESRSSFWTESLATKSREEDEMLPMWRDVLFHTLTCMLGMRENPRPLPVQSMTAIIDVIKVKADGSFGPSACVALPSYRALHPFAPRQAESQNFENQVVKSAKSCF